ncbi:MAG TPA: c-type cytochrome [Bryobacteraceae bacterium]|jgi:putative heme-binding domain-containing protein|nr:c-type cytochrome [Bryobacteraceae bacterium]
MTRRLKVIAGFLLVCRLVSGQGTEPGPQPKTTREDVTEGQRIFGTQCSYCHGPKGEGGQGAVLAVPRLSHAPDDQALFRIIREGISGTRMPASALTTGQVWQVAAFVRTLGRVEGSKSSGDQQRGHQIFVTKGGCAKCHTIAGHGGAIGPDLTDIGDRREAAALRTSLLEPSASVPLDFLQVRVVTKDGHTFTGVRINEDAFSIQFRDLSNQFHSLWKNELTGIVKEPKRSIMPSYQSILTAAELDDVVAYLESLQGRP